jgi:signal transduction histidine kinase/CheY-like chemotaxis protein
MHSCCAHLIQRLFSSQRLKHPYWEGAFLSLGIFFVVMLSLGWIYYQSYVAAFNGIKTHLGDIGRIAASQVKAQSHDQILSPSSIYTPEYDKVVAPLVNIHNSTPDVVYLYTMRVKDGHFYFVVDTATRFSELKTSFALKPSLPMDRYSFPAHVTGELLQDIYAGKAFVEDSPSVDDFGTFITGVAPFYDSDGKLSGVVGVDFGIDQLSTRMNEVRHALLEALFLAGLVSIFAGIVLARIRRRSYQEEIIRRQMEKDLRESSLRAQAASRAKSDFLANMSHEIRTPLNGILSMVTFIESTELKGEQVEAFDTIKSSSKLLMSVISDILDISKIESGKLVLEATDFNLKHAFNQVIVLFQKSAHEKNRSIELVEKNEIPTYIRGDEGRIQQILMNLIGNAIKFSDHDNITVELSSEFLENADRQLLTFVVRDCGVGIPEEKLKILFEPFKQADEYITRKHGGNGLGLAICKKLVNLMQGTIEVDTQLGVGTAFTVRIIVEPSSSKIEPSQKVKALVEKISPSTQPLDILLVEDNLINQKVAFKLLEKLGHRVDIANNGLEAISSLEKKKYNLILMDVQMPVMDGLEATRQICTRWRSDRPRIVALTAHAMKEQLEECITAGMDACLTKPIRLDALNEQIRAVQLD